MIYNSIKDLYLDNEELILDSDLSYIIENREKILDSSYGSENVELFTMNNTIRGLISSKISIIREYIWKLYEKCYISYLEIQENKDISIDCITEKVRMISYIYNIISINISTDKKESDFIFNEIKDDLMIIDIFKLFSFYLDEYDKLNNINKFEYKYFITHSYVLSYYIDKYLFNESIKSLEEYKSLFNKESH